MAANTETAKKDHLYEIVADNLEKDIVSGIFTERRLPSEQMLSTRYGVSRTVIREALKILTERRMVSVTAGSGAYITRPDAYDLSIVFNRLIQTHDIDYMDAYDVRIVLEAAAAAACAQHVTDDEIRHMERLLENLRDKSAPVSKKIELDLEFHVYVAKCSHNEMLSLLVDAMSGILQDIITIGITINTSSEDIVKGISHARVLRAIKDRNPLAAQSVMYDHLYSSKMIYKRYMEKLRSDREAEEMGL